MVYRTFRYFQYLVVVYMLKISRCMVSIRAAPSLGTDYRPFTNLRRMEQWCRVDLRGGFEWSDGVGWSSFGGKLGRLGNHPLQDANDANRQGDGISSTS